MTDQAPYPDVEIALVEVQLDDLGFTCTATDEQLQERVKTTEVIRVMRVGGPDDGQTDRARVRVDVHARTRALAWSTARLVQQRLSGRLRAPLDLGGPAESGLQRAPSDDEGVFVVTATYPVSARRARHAGAG